MKKSILKISAVCMMLAAMSSSSFAQEKPERKRDASKKIESQNTRGPIRPGRGMFDIPNATEEQKALLKELKDKRDENEKALEATYDAKQKEIAANTTMSFRDKRMALIQSYSESQKELVKKQSEELRATREKLSKTLTEEQKANMRPQGPRNNNNN